MPDDEIKENEIVKKLVRTPNNVPNSKLLTGYMGKSDKEDNIRLYLNLEFNSYVDIPQKKILLHKDVPEETIPLGAVYVWIPKDLDLEFVNVNVTKIQAEFLDGPISKSYRSPANSNVFLGWGWTWTLTPATGLACVVSAAVDCTPGCPTTGCTEGRCCPGTTSCFDSMICISRGHC